MILSGPLVALQHRAFAVILSSIVVSQAGFWMSTVTFQWLIAKQSATNPLTLGILAFFNYLPLLLFSVPCGYLADRFDRTRIIVCGWLAIGAIAGLLAAGSKLDLLSVPLLYVGAFAIGTALAVNAPASQAIVANSVPRNHLASAVSLQSAGQNLMRVAGPALATPALTKLGATFVYALYSTASILAAAAIFRINVRRGQSDSTGGGVIHRIQVGWQHARERRPALLILVSVAVVSTFGFSYTAMLPVFAYSVWKAGDSGFAGLLSAGGAGAVVGALASGLRTRPLSLRAAALHVVALGTCLIAFASSPSYVVSLALVAILGGVAFATMTSLNTMLQSLVDDAKRGRVMSLFILAWGGMIPLGSLLIGAVSGFIPVPIVSSLFGAACSLYGVAIFIYARALGHHEVAS